MLYVEYQKHPMVVIILNVLHNSHHFYISQYQISRSKQILKCPPIKLYLRIYMVTVINPLNSKGLNSSNYLVSLMI